VRGLRFWWNAGPDRGTLSPIVNKGFGQKDWVMSTTVGAILEAERESAKAAIGLALRQASLDR